MRMVAVVAFVVAFFVFAGACPVGRDLAVVFFVVRPLVCGFFVIFAFFFSLHISDKSRI
jgi:hypothetical protein